MWIAATEATNAKGRKRFMWLAKGRYRSAKRWGVLSNAARVHSGAHARAPWGPRAGALCRYTRQPLTRPPRTQGGAARPTDPSNQSARRLCLRNFAALRRRPPGWLRRTCPVLVFSREPFARAPRGDRILAHTTHLFRNRFLDPTSSDSTKIKRFH